MVSINRVIIAGRLKDAPELKTVASNRKFATMVLVIDDMWKGKDGEVVKKSTFVNIICWGSLAENVVKYLTKGKSAMVEGHIETDTYTDSKGNKHSSTRINASNIVFLESSKPESKGARDYAY